MRACKLVCVLCLCVGLMVGCGNRRTVSDPFNIVLIDVDTLRPDFLGVYGGRHTPTPNIDSLAADGIVFENASSPSPITGPSHAALFTSRHPSELGLINNGASELPAAVPVMAEILSEAGFDTGAVIAIAPIRGQWGFDRGFDTFEDRLHNSWILNADAVIPWTLEVLDGLEPPFFLWSHLSDPHEPYNAHGLVAREVEISINGQPIARISSSEAAVQLIDMELQAGKNDLKVESEHAFKITRLSLRRRGWIKPEIAPERPPHDYLTEYHAQITSWRARKVQLVIQLSDRIDDGQQRIERYAREVAYVDQHVGQVIESLKSKGLYDESLILLTADHGEGLGCHGYGGHIETLYDCMIRVPMIVKPPIGSGLDVGQRRRDVAGLIDVLPTVLGMLGVEPRPEMRGRDLLASDELEDATLLMETHRPQAQSTLYGLRGRSHSIIFNATSESWEFYDLEEDPDQLENLFDSRDPLVAEWATRLRQRLHDEVHLIPGVEVSSAADEETEEMLRSLGYL